MGSLFSTLIAVKSGVFALKGIIAIIGLISLLLGGLFSCNKVLRTYKQAGAAEVERQVMASAIENGQKQLANQKELTRRSRVLQSAYEDNNRQIREQYAQEKVEWEERLATAHEDENICRNCTLP